MVRNIHTRDLCSSLLEVGQLIDGLASEQDRLWPHESWPAMHFDRPLSVGAVGGHGPLRYTVESYKPGTSICFRFTAPDGFEGTHGFDVSEVRPGLVRLQHTLCMRLKRGACISWPFIYRWLHDALIEDALDRAEAAVTSSSVHRHSWSLWVRLLRRLARAKGGRTVA
ncbi:SRPBCC family protein [Ktedonosporobacter rubrisoli]|uniref:SRPBCC family protein n=1 Tax=Ktedonosporobacter rubrisoli TaxID=2509675 RepID=A0A4P6JQ98_KTERU|nr:SRPBCC family protein [Ktedonosporobacter rubrisoli]QBD77454.1 SRPBCC family protein [Ktedonosporobacter rubrisoli]